MSFNAHFLFLLCILWLPSAYAGEPARLDFQAYSHGELVYSLTLDSGGRVDVMAIEGQGRNIAKYSGTAMIDCHVFDALFHLLENVEPQADGGFQSRGVDAIVVLEYLGESKKKEVSLAGMSPMRRRLLFDLFSVTHTFASDRGDAFWGGEIGFVRTNRYRQVLRYQRILVGLGAVIVLLILWNAVLARRKNSIQGSKNASVPGETKVTK